MATVIPIGQPRNDAERILIGHLRDHLPSVYTIIHNFELNFDGEYNEIDLAIIAPHAVYLVDAKGTRGNIETYSGKWFPEGRQPFISPLLKLRAHARAFKGMLIDADQKMKPVYVDAVIVLTSSDAKIVDADGKDKPSVLMQQECVDYFKNASKVPARYTTTITGFQNAILNRLRGKARPSQKQKRYDVYEIKERLGATDQFEEFRAFNYHVGEKGGYVSLKVYRLEQYSTPEVRKLRKDRIQVAYRTLSRLPSHHAICGVRDFRAVDEHETEFILVSEEVQGEALRKHLVRANMALTFEQKIRAVHDILCAIAHAHTHGVRHRNINPDNIIIGIDGQPRLNNFDYARDTEERSFTVANEIIDNEDEAYMAPEFYTAPQEADEKADIFSFGVIIYELFSGQKPFPTPDDCLHVNGTFPVPLSSIEPSLMPGFDIWAQSFCLLESVKRPSAAEALAKLDKMLSGATDTKTSIGSQQLQDTDYTDLQPGTELLRKYRIEKLLGRGGFGVVYKVFDMLADEYRALKIIYRGTSKVERLKQEFKTLLRLNQQRHANVVNVYEPGFLNDEIPYLPTEFIDGQNLKELIDQGTLLLPEAYQACCDALKGLEYLHERGVFHCDIKPGNLMWAGNKVVIIDFNVAYHAEIEGENGASKRYLPPEYDDTIDPTDEERRFRDLYAAGITFYECVTGKYPWPGASRPPRDTEARDPREYEKCHDLSPRLAEVILKAIHPKKNKRFQSAHEFLIALEKASVLRMKQQTEESTAPLTSARDNGRHIFLDYIQSIFSQNPRSNAGTRGLSELAAKTYVDTSLDKILAPAVVDGAYQLIIVTGNAGDGKTAFLQKLEEQFRAKGARIVKNDEGNGCRIDQNGYVWYTNYDGSQDEGERSNNLVLQDFFSPFAGTSAAAWPTRETRIIAINEGRLIDFLDTHRNEFPYLTRTVRKGLKNSVPIGKCAVVNLTHRNVTAAGENAAECIFDRVLKKLVSPKHWEGCAACELANRCYVRHNVLSFSLPESSPELIKRLRMLYALSIMRNKQHITIRALRSALAYMIAGTRTCEEIRSLYAMGDNETILKGYYFNSWSGGAERSSDELLELLQEIDIGRGTNPRIDRMLDFCAPDEVSGLRLLEDRSSSHIDYLKNVYQTLPATLEDPESFDRHREYLEMMRRLFYFEQRDTRWQTMLPYVSLVRFIELIDGKRSLYEETGMLLSGMNRGEGLMFPEPLKGQLALNIRQVEKGTIMSFRLFPAENFTLKLENEAIKSPFVEHQPEGLVLAYTGENGDSAELTVDLDIFEMIYRLNAGYRPTIEDMQGFYQGFTVFKNRLSAATYSRLMLTITGHSFVEIVKDEHNGLIMKNLEKQVQ